MKSKVHFLLFMLASLVTCGTTHANTITWTNVAGGNWSLAANWSPNAVPGSGDTASITNAGTYAVTLDVAANVSNLTIGGAGSGVQTLQGNGFNLGATNALIGNGGILDFANATFTGGLTIATNGLLSADGANSALYAQVTVASGGKILALVGGFSLGQYGGSSDPGYWLWVQGGGQVDVASGAVLNVYAMMTNAGLVNVTNQGIYVSNNGSLGADGGLVNQAGGVIDLWNNASLTGSGGDDYLVNQGTINLGSGAGTSDVILDNLTNSGTMTTQPGTGQLDIGYFNGLGSLMGTYNAAAGSLIQFYAQNSPGTSVGAGLTLAGAGAYEFVQGLLTLPTNVIPDLALDGGTVALGADFQGGAITNLGVSGVSLTTGLPITGTLTMTGGTLSTTNTLANGASLNLSGTTVYGAITITNNGLLSADGANSALYAQVTVASGGKILALVGGFSLGQYGGSSDPGYWLWVQGGGQVDVASGAVLNVYAMMTNAGLVNVTNQGIYVSNNGSLGADGGLVNQAGGVIDLWNNASLTGSGGDDYLVNQGTINLGSGAGTSDVILDNLTNSGTMTTQPGTGQLDIGYFNGLGSLMGTYNAAAGSLIQFYAQNSPGTSVGAGLTLAGAGAYEFVQGLLTLPTNVIPDLALDGGTVALGADFQGGAITNLGVSGVSLTTGLPITGTLTMTGGTLSTTNTLANGASLNLSGTTVYGAITITNNGLLSADGANSALYAQVTVASGGKILALVGGFSLGQYGGSSDPGYWLWVQGGGQVDVASGAVLNVYAMMTNAGLVNVTNQGIYVSNNGSLGADGGLVNQAGGVIDLWNNASLTGSGGDDYLVNQGTINLGSGAGTSDVILDNITNSGTLSARHGTLQLQDTHLTLQPSETFSVDLNSATDYGGFSINGNAALTGSFVVQLNNDFIPAAGTSFSVFSYGSYSGNFTSFSNTNSPGDLVWQPVYGSTELTLVAQPPILLLPSGTNVAVKVNGTSGQQAILLTTTNLAVPLSNWTPVATNTFDATSYLSFTNGLNPDTQRQFFIFKLP